MWFTETPWPPAVLCACLCTMAVVVWQQRKRRRFLYGAVLFAVLGALAFVVDAWVVTSAERVEEAVYALIAAVRDDSRQFDLKSPLPSDRDIKTLQFISTHAIAIRSLVRRGLQLVRIDDEPRVSDVQITMKANGSRAIAHFRVNATFSSSLVTAPTYKPTRWELTWQPEGNEWRVVRVQRLNFITGEPFANPLSAHP